MPLETPVAGTGYSGVLLTRRIAGSGHIAINPSDGVDWAEDILHRLRKEPAGASTCKLRLCR